MRVAVVLEQCLLPTPGGTGRYARELAAALAAGAGPTDQVGSWIASHRDASPARVPGVVGPQAWPVPSRALAVLWERGVGPAPRGADVVHAPTLLMPPRRSARLVVTIHDAVPWSHPETLTPRGVAFHRRMAERARRTADLVVTPSASSHAELEAVLRLGDRLVTVPPGLSPNLLPPPDAAERRRRLGLPEEYVLSVSTLEPRKGLDLLVRAMARTGARGPGAVPLVVVGPTGWGGVDVAEVADREGLARKQLHLLGQITEADLASCYAGATVFAMTSRAEGFGLPVLEAMAAGAPVVCTDIPALAELAGGAADLVPPDPDAIADAITRLILDPSLRAVRQAAGRRRAAHFSWASSARVLWEYYRAL